MTSKIDLISTALVLIGDVPINTTDGSDRRQIVSERLYDTIVENELTKYRWGFARRKAQLSLLTVEPIDNDYQKAYQLPTDLLTLIKLSPISDYQIYGDQVYCNFSQSLYCDYILRPDESEWPAYFYRVVEYALAKDLATSIRDSSASRVEMTAEYENQSRMARYTDAQQHPQTPIAHRPFIDVRR